MEELLIRIKELENISKELEPTEADRNDHFQQIQDFSNRFINDIQTSKACSGEKVKRDLLAIDGHKKPLKDIIDVYRQEVADKGINAASGRHVGYIPGGGLYFSAVADFMAALTNEYAGLYLASPGAVIIENEILNWMKSIFGFPESAAGSLTSGGSMANLIALTAARDHHKIILSGTSKSVVYLSPQTHHCVPKALKIIGLENVIIRHIRMDKHWRMDANDLDTKIKKDKREGLNPFLVVATAGTTDTGAVDPLMEIGNIAGKYNLWYHVDAAYGGFFILTDQKKELFRGIEMADSLVTDPHKGLFIPYGTGAVLVKNREAVMQSHRYTANYMQDSTRIDPDIFNPSDISPELTRHFRALRIWLPLQMHGIEPFKACLEEKLLLTSYFRNRLSESGFETGPDPDLSVSYFWYPYKKGDQDAFNRRFLELLYKDGNAFFSSTIIDGKFVIRLAILSFRTKLKTIDQIVNILNNIRLKLEKEFTCQG